MKVSGRLVVFVFFLLTILLVGMIFWPFVLNEIIAPASLAAWVLLRIFILSIDQKYFWGAIIFIATFFLFRCLLPQVPPPIQIDDFQRPNETMRSIDYWLRLFTVIDRKVEDDRTLKKELAYLVLMLYASKQHIPTSFQLYDALQSGRVPLPEHIRTHIFPAEPRKSVRSIRSLIQSIQKTSRKWIRRWTKQDVAEHYRMIAEVLGFMETSLEIENDERKFIPNKH